MDVACMFTPVGAEGPAGAGLGVTVDEGETVEAVLTAAGALCSFAGICLTCLGGPASEGGPAAADCDFVLGQAFWASSGNIEVTGEVIVLRWPHPGRGSSDPLLHQCLRA